MLSEITNHLHPILIHFPIVMITISLLYDLFLAWKKKQLYPTNGLWLWIISAIGAAVSVATGPEELARGNTIYLSTHSLLGNVTMWLSFAIVAFRLWKWFNQTEIRRVWLGAYLLFALVTCVCVLTTGYYGGKMVYDQGIGVKKNGSYITPPKARQLHHQSDY
jgi:uncharacterized membrane protein